MFFFFNDTATTEIYTLSLHDALPIWRRWSAGTSWPCWSPQQASSMVLRALPGFSSSTDRKSTRLNSSHGYISYAVFCLKKKKKFSLENVYKYIHLMAREHSTELHSRC